MRPGHLLSCHFSIIFVFMWQGTAGFLKLPTGFGVTSFTASALKYWKKKKFLLGFLK